MSQMARMFTCAEALVRMMDGSSFESTGLPRVYNLTSERVAHLREVKGMMPIH